MEITWTLGDHQINGYWKNKINAYRLMMKAQHYITVQGRKKLFRYSDIVINPSSVNYCLKYFEEQAKEFFFKIEESLK